MATTSPKLLGAVLLAAIVAAPLSALGEQQASDQDVSKMLRQMHDRMAQQDKRIAELEARLTDKKLREVRRGEMMLLLKEMNADAANRTALPQWMENLTFYGDLRLRYQAECWDDDTGSKTRHRARFRLRFGIIKTWLDEQLEVGFRLATGEAADAWDNAEWTSLGGGSDPTSANQTFTGMFSQKRIWVDRAWATYRPNWLKGFMITGGKIANPFQTSKYFIDSDVNPEGVYAQYTVQGLGAFAPFVGMGFFILDEESVDVDTQMHGYALGMTWKVADDVKWTLVANLWDYDHYDDADGPPSARGNTAGWTWDFLVINVHTKVDFKALDLPMSVFADFAKNCKEDEGTANYHNKNCAFHAGIKVGTNKKKGDWSAGYEYAYIEHNSLPGFLTDGDFARTNRQGHILKGKYNITNFLTAGLTVFLTEPIQSSSEDEKTLVQVDLMWKF